MRLKATPVVYLLMLFLLFATTVFRIQHWFGGVYLFYLSSIAQICFIALIAKEVLSSKKGSFATKIAWVTFYALLLPITIYLYITSTSNFLLVLPTTFFAGIIYLTFGRRKFASKKEKVSDRITFDSF